MIYEAVFKVVLYFIGAVVVKIVTFGKTRLPPFDKGNGDLSEDLVALIGLGVVVLAVVAVVFLPR